jgi:hypothetical protein
MVGSYRIINPHTATLQDGEMVRQEKKEYSTTLNRKGVHFEHRESTSIKVNPELWKEVKIEAIRRDIEISELVELALKKELNKNP